MYVSRLNFYTLPGKSSDVQRKLQVLRDMVVSAGGIRPRILRTHFASLGAPDVVFEQEAPDLASLEDQIRKVTESADFQAWTREMSGMLAQSPHREVYLIVDSR